MQNLFASNTLIQQAMLQASARIQAAGGSPAYPQPQPGSHQGSPVIPPVLSQAMRQQYSQMAAAAQSPNPGVRIRSLSSQPASVQMTRMHGAWHSMDAVELA